MADQVVFELPQVSLQPDSDSPDSDHRYEHSNLARLIAEDAREPFDLAQPPLIRARLYRLAPQQHVLVIVLHHIIADGWSLDVLLHDLAALYPDPARAAVPGLVELAAGQIAFAAWQQQRLADGELDASLAWWRDQLIGVEPLELPTDRQRPAQPSYAGGLHEFQIAADTVTRLKGLSRQHGCTLFMSLLATFQALLSRWTGQSDIAVGSPVAGRQLPQLEPLIGYFVNTIVLRTQMQDDPSFSQMLERVRTTCLGAFSHQDYPFDRLVAELAPVRDPSRNPYFQVSFALQNVAQSAWQLQGLHCTPVPVHTATSKFDMSMALVEQADGSLVGQVEYASDLFDACTIERLARHMDRLLQAVTADPALRMSRIDLLTAGERDQLEAFAGSTEDLGPAPTLLQAFEAQVRRQPQAVAIVENGRSVDYASLDRHACAIAGQLRAQGLGHEALIGIGIERSATQIAALLGIHKAGAAWLPLDTRQPQARLQRVLADARPGAVLVTNAAPAHWSALDTRLMTVDSGSTITCDDPPSIALSTDPPTAGNTACVMYKSSSTDEPIGVVLSRDAVDDQLHWICHRLGLTASDRVLQLTPLGFAPAVWELFGPLVSGGAVQVAPGGAESDPGLLAATVRDRQITVLQLVPSTLQLLIDEPVLAQCHGLRLMVVGGEPLTTTLACRVKARLPWVELGNLYGATECGLGISFESVGTLPARAGSVPVGRPIGNTHCEVLDASLRPVPTGVVGRLHVAGTGLASGYLNRPDLTAEHFIIDPRQPGQRLYRTGDQARWLADGRLEHLGRIDDQIRLRGVRIEFSQIEATLDAHPDVRASAVTLQPDGAQEPRLIAWIVPIEPHSFDENRLRRWLKSHLPQLMWPSTYQAIDALPKLPDGRIARRALPGQIVPTMSPGSAGDASAQASVNATELAVAQVWAELLALPRVSVDDNFFDLGGHSLIAYRAVERLRIRCGADINVKMLFDSPTVAEFSAQIQARQCTAPGTSSAIPRARAVGPRPLSHAQEGLWFLDRLNGSSALYNVPFAIRLRGSIDNHVLQVAINEQVTRHPALRTRFESVHGNAVQHIESGTTVALELVDLAVIPGGTRDTALHRAMGERACAPFELGRAPLIRATLFRLDERDRVLMFVVHHIVFDGWSSNVLMEELGQCYASLLEGRAPQLDPLPMLFADFAAWQRDRQRDADHQRQLQYWRSTLSGLAALNLPTDIRRPAQTSHRGAITELALPGRLTTRLKALSREHGCTLFMTVLAAFQGLLARWTGQTDIAVGTPVAGRQLPELEPLIGHFVNTVVLRTALDHDPRFSDLLDRVRATCLGAFSNQDIPFDRLVAELAPSRDMSRNPLFQVSFSLQDAAQFALRLPQVECTPMPLHTDTAKFDLSLSFAEQIDGSLLGQFEYATDLFHQTTIDHLAAAMLATVDALAHEPSRRLSQLMLSGLSPQTQAGTAAAPTRPASTDLAPSGVPTSDHGALERLLGDIWAKTLGTDQVAPDDDFFDIGGHSLLALRLLDAIEQRTGHKLVLASFLGAPTVRRQAALLAQASAPADTGCVVSLRACGDRPPLFFVSGWGGAILPFKALAEQLDADQPLHVLDLMHFGADGKPVTSMQQLAACMLADLQRIQPHGPYQLAGFSLGGMVVYELAQQLRGRGEQVAVLALLDTPAPGYPIRRSMAGRVVRHLSVAGGLTPQAACAHLWRVATNIAGRLRGATPPELDDVKSAVRSGNRVARSLAESANATFAVWRDYKPAFYPGAMVLIRAGLRPPEPGYLDNDLYQGWTPLIGGGISLRTLPCEHRRMLDAQHAPVLAAVLQSCLMQAPATLLQPNMAQAAQRTVPVNPARAAATEMSL